MKFSIEIVKEWINSDLIKGNLIDTLVFNGFESYLDEKNIVISIPYNRNDCQSLFGIFYNLLNSGSVKKYSILHSFKNEIDIFVENKLFCPLFYGIVIKNININNKIPSFIKETLANNNVNSVNLIVDIINYVTIITGQPLHAYDLDFLNGNVSVSKSNCETKIISLNKQEIKLLPGTAIIKDSVKIISLPGIIGLSNTMLTEKTKNIFLESAYFNGYIIDDISKKYNIQTNSSNLFKNIINFEFTRFALIYATYLINNITSSISSNILEKKFYNYILKERVLKIDSKKIHKMLGYNIDKYKIENSLLYLNFKFIRMNSFWKIYIPYYRKDLIIEENLIAEIFKFYGYNNVNYESLKSEFNFDINNLNNKFKLISSYLINNGFTEVITYSFVDSRIEEKLYPDKEFIFLKNPIANNFNILRVSLLQGLLKTVKNNLNKSNENISFFEIGNVFNKNLKKYAIKTVAGVSSGDTIYTDLNYYVDTKFFIFKTFVKNICELFFENINLFFKKNNVNYLKTDVSSLVSSNECIIGNFGLIDNKILNLFDIKKKLYFFEIFLNSENKFKVKKYNKISIYPKVKRDISIILDFNIEYERIILYVNNLNICILNKILLLNIFYFSNKTKSVTIRLCFSSMKKTLIEKEILFIVIFLQEKIKTHFGASIKSK